MLPIPLEGALAASASQTWLFKFQPINALSVLHQTFKGLPGAFGQDSGYPFLMAVSEAILFYP
jgi:hypothetical protein